MMRRRSRAGCGGRRWLPRDLGLWGLGMAEVRHVGGRGGLDDIMTCVAPSFAPSTASRRSPSPAKAVEDEKRSVVDRLLRGQDVRSGMRISQAGRADGTSA